MRKRGSKLSVAEAERLICALVAEGAPMPDEVATARRIAARLPRALKAVGVGGDGIRAARDVELASAARAGRLAAPKDIRNVGKPIADLVEAALGNKQSRRPKGKMS